MGYISEVHSLPHDPDLVDKLTGFGLRRFEGTVWRATRLNQDPIAFSYNGGRWAPPSSYQSVPVLYTSFERDAAIAEMSSWLSMLTPRPTKPILVHRLNVTAAEVVTLDTAALADLGIDQSNYGDRTYAAMGQAPPSRSQEVGAALSFLGIDGLVVPSARWPGNNLVLFDNLDHQIEIDASESEEVNWTSP